MARLPYPDPGVLPPQTAAALATLPVRNVFSMMAHAATLAPPVFEFTNVLFKDMQLEARLRQVAILRVGYLCESQYEVYHHEKAGRAAGLSAEEMNALKKGAAQHCLGPREIGVARFAEEMTLQVKASEQAFAAVRAFLSEREMVELTLVVGFYNMVARFLETLEIEIEPRSAKQGGR
jgi:alkylhydroperoxidase family enzyme